MSEVVKKMPSPEEAVFGNAFSFSNGLAQGDAVNTFFEERVASVKSGAKTWLPRTLDADHGICADLYKDGKVIATLDFDYDDNSASVYTTSEDGNFGDTTLCDRASFADAVAAVDKYVEA
jgi:hypothetical protein